MTVFPKITLPIALPLLRVRGKPAPAAAPPLGPPPPPTGSGTGPNTVTRLLAWYRPDTLSVVDGSEITTWIDSAGGYSANAIGGVGSRITVQRNAIKSISAAVGGIGKRGAQYVNPHYPTPGAPAFSTPDTWSVFAIVKFTGNSDMVFFMGDGGNFGVRIGISAGKLMITLCDVGNFSSNESVSLNAWHYILVTSSSGYQRAWVDGHALTGYSGAHYMSYQSGVLAVADGAGAFQGSMAELAYYNKAVGAHGRLKLFNYSRIVYGL